MSLGSQTTQHENRTSWRSFFQQQQAVQTKCRLSIEPQENGEAMSIVNLISHRKLTNRNWFVPVGSGIKMHNILNEHLETTPTLGCTRMPVVNEDSLEFSRKHGKTYSLLLGYAPGEPPHPPFHGGNHEDAAPPPLRASLPAPFEPLRALLSASPRAQG